MTELETRTTYTPGPWRYDQFSDPSPEFGIWAESDDRFIATVGDAPYERDDTEANARLIAAAPRMAEYILLYAERDPEARVILREAGVLR